MRAATRGSIRAHHTLQSLPMTAQEQLEGFWAPRTGAAQQVLRLGIFCCHVWTSLYTSP